EAARGGGAPQVPGAGAEHSAASRSGRGAGLPREPRSPCARFRLRRRAGDGVIVVEPVPDLSEPRGGAASTRKRLLVRMPNWIGDGVMATPAVFALARALPGWTIALQATPRTWSLWQGVEEPFELLPPLRLGERRSHLVREARRLRERRFDAALVLPPSFSSMLLPALAGIPVRVGWSSELRRILTTHPVPGRTRTRHLRDQYHELAEAAARTLGGAALEPSGETRLPLTVEEITR